MVSVGYGCCVGSWDRFNRYVLPHAGDRPVLGVSGQTSIAEAYNVALNWAEKSNFDMLILQHDDLEITDEFAEKKFAEAFTEDDVELVGIAGGSSRSGLAWWNCEPIGHQATDAMMIDFGQREGVVELLEGSLLVFSRWAIKYLRFELRSGFHGYDEIAARLWRRHSRRALVVDVDTHHHTSLGFDSEASHQDWLAADEWFRKKWSITW